MFDHIENVKIISSFHNINRPGGKIEKRPTNVFFIRTHGNARYDFPTKSISVSKGEVIFIPKGAAYIYKTFPEGAASTSICFEADFAAPEPILFSLHHFYKAEYIGNHFSTLWNFGTQAERYKCLSLFYDLLSYLSTLENTSYADKKKFSVIDPAVMYLKAHIFDEALHSCKLHRLCGISDTYFRKIFVSRFGMNPQEYITAKRLSHAKSVLESGDYDTVREIAQSVGYSDPLYFSKVFKKRYGISPSDINK